MATANINDLRIHNARNFLESLHGPNGEYRSYMFLGRTTPWEIDDETQDELPPTPTSAIEEFYRTYQEMISMRYIQQDDVFYMIRRNTWVTGTIYDIYRHDYTPTRLSYSGARNLYDATFYVINQNNVVYVCLDNNNNAASTVEPQNDSSDAFYTSDGYLWLKIYTINNIDMYNHATERYIPITTDSYSSTVEGAIYNVEIEVAGSGYTTNPAGIANQIPFYFCNILGDGTGAVARVSISNQKITEIVVVRNGSGYTYGVVDLTASATYYASEADLRAGTSPLTLPSSGYTAPNVEIVIAPQGGHGSDIYRELGARNALVYSRIENDTENPDFVTGNEIARVGLVQNPKAYNTSTNLELDKASATYALKLTGAGYSSATFTADAFITQTVGLGSTAVGRVVSYDQTTGVLKYWQDRSTAGFNTDGSKNTSPEYGFKMNRFTPNITDGGSFNIIGGSSTLAIQTSFTGISTEINSRTYYLGQSFTEGAAQPEVEKYTGNIIYVDNRPSITRSSSQKEDIKIILQF